jgi:putative PIN family toxin of toxin-antitoxin system
VLRAVVDTSSLVSFVITQGEIMARVIAHWRAGEVLLLSSPATRDELATVLARPAIQRLSVVPLDPFVEGMQRFTHPVPGHLVLAGACRDPRDDKFLACAVEGLADYLVSSDRDLLDMRRYETVAIVNPGQFLLAMELHAMDAASMARRFGHDVLSGIATTMSLDPATTETVAAALTLFDTDAS